MACLKLGSKPDGFQRKGQAWFCTSGLPSDVVIEVEEMSFHLHKFPLVSRSGKLSRLTDQQSENEGEILHLQLPDMPGGPDAFELTAKFCYGVRLELTASNVVLLRCAAEYLEMTEEFGEGNLIARTEGFFNQVTLRNWKECTRALHSCESVLPQAEELGIVNTCVDAIATMACTDPSLLGWPMSSSMQSPGGSFLWNGISTGARLKKPRSDWWYEDISVLSLSLYKRVILAMEVRGIKPESISGALMHFGRRYLPALNKRQGTKEGSGRFGSLSLTSIPSETDQRTILETIEGLLPMQKSIVPTRFLSGLLRSAMILNASLDCKGNLERRVGMQLEQASLEDLLLPNLSYNLETLYDIESTHRILDHFLLLEQSAGASSSPSSVGDDGRLISSPSLTPIMMVARLMDGYLAEVAPDVNLKLSKFLLFAEVLPDFSRISDDGLYRAIDIYLKAHPWLKEEEREQLCRLIDCQKLSLEACTHAAQNERLPLRVVVQVLFFEQLQLRTAIASCFMVSDGSRPLRHLGANDGPVSAGAALRGEGWANAFRDNHTLKVDMDHMKLRVSDLEKECSGMREEIEKLGKVQGHWRVISKALGGRFKSHICSTKENAVQDQAETSGYSQGPPHPRRSRHHRTSSLS